MTKRKKILLYAVTGAELLFCLFAVCFLGYFLFFLSSSIRRSAATNLVPLAAPALPAPASIEDERVRQALLDLLKQEYYEPDILDKLPQLRTMGTREIIRELNVYESGGDPAKRAPAFLLSNYVFTAEEYNKFNDHFEGNPKAVGTGFFGMPSPDGEAYLVLRVLPGTPADRAGLRKGDEILEVDGQPIKGLPFPKVTGAIRGQAGVPVSFRVRRAGSANFNLTLQREMIEFSYVWQEVLAENIGYLHISELWPAAVADTERAIESLTARGAAALIFDLRNNMGGVSEKAIDIAQFFLPRGSGVFATDIRGEERQARFSKGDPIWNGPMVTLINGHTMASAEALAIALKEHGRSPLMGQRTFGKGSVQAIFSLSGSFVVKITTGRLCSPLGQPFHGTGIAPDLEVADPENVYAVVTLAPDTIADDPQLQAAVEYLKAGMKDEG